MRRPRQLRRLLSLGHGYSDHPLKQNKLLRPKISYRSLWPEATTFTNSPNSYLQSNATVIFVVVRVYNYEISDMATMDVRLSVTRPSLAHTLPTKPINAHLTTLIQSILHTITIHYTKILVQYNVL